MRRAITAAALCCLIGCGGGQTKKDAAPTDPADMDAPTAEELAASPCGNPDWSELPPGSDPPE